LTVPAVDLHVHSTASDGSCSPADVVRRAASAGLAALALTDHDTLAGVAEAAGAAGEHGVRLVPGCEFSVASRWGELHVLAYFVRPDDPELAGYLTELRDRRRERAVEIVGRLNRAGIPLTVDEVLTLAAGGAVGRPHVARALVARAAVPDVASAFAKYLGQRRPAFVPKRLPAIEDVTALVRRAGGVTSAAHLGEQGVRSVLRELKQSGVDGVEVLHPAHDLATAGRIRALAAELGLLATGGSDWHGDDGATPTRAPLGSLDVPLAWLEALQARAGKRGGG
jgi:hypothetical protein